MGRFLDELRRTLHPHYFTNLILAVSFFFLKTVTPFCDLLFETCALELKEWELLTFLGCIIVLKNRKQPSFRSYFGTVCMFAKILSCIMYMRQNPILGIVFMVLCLLHLAFIPEPMYKGPDCIVYFKGPELEDEVKRDVRVTWLIEFYAAWSPPCVSFASTFAELSSKYGLENFKFGKLDVTRYKNTADRFRVNSSSWTKQLPTLILFEGGKESMRRPAIDSNYRVVNKFIFSWENIVKDFGLNEIYNICKKNPLKKRKVKKDLEKPIENEKQENGKVKSEQQKKKD